MAAATVEAARQVSQATEKSLKELELEAPGGPTALRELDAAGKGAAAAALAIGGQSTSPVVSLRDGQAREYGATGPSFSHARKGAYH